MLVRCTLSAHISFAQTPVPGAPEDLLTQLSTALHMLTTASPSSSEVLLDDLLIRYEEVLQTANCGLLDPSVLTQDRQEVTDEIRITKVH